MSLLWVRITKHGDKSMENTHIGHLILYFSEEVVFP